MRSTHSQYEPTRIEYQGLSLQYSVSTKVLDEVDLVVEPAETLALLGSSGSGKTSLMRATAGLIRPRNHKRSRIEQFLSSMLAGSQHVDLRGRILFGEKDVTDLRPQSRNVAMVRQTWDLLPNLTARETLLLTMRLGGDKGSRAESRAMEVLESVGLADKAHRKPSELSGGEVQRLAIGRLLVRPYVRAFLFDECLSSLDPSLRRQILRLIQTHLRERSVTTLWVTHLVDEVRQLRARVGILDKGRLVQVGPLGEVEGNPATVAAHKIVSGQEESAIGSGIVESECLIKLVSGKTLSLPSLKRRQPEEKVLIAVRNRGWRMVDGDGLEGEVIDCVPVYGRGYEVIFSVEGWLASVWSERPWAVSGGARILPNPEDVFPFDPRDGKRLG